MTMIACRMVRKGGHIIMRKTPEERSALQNARNKARRAADPEGEKQKAREYRAAHLEKMRENSRRYYERHKAAENARKTAYNRRKRAERLGIAADET